MFSAVLDDPKVLKECIDIASQIVDEGVIKITKDGLELNAIDRAMVAALNLKLNSSLFSTYECGEEKTIGINLLSLLSILKRCGAEDKVKLTLSDSKLNIELQGEFKRSFSIPLLDIAAEDLSKVSQLKYASSIELNPAVFESGIADADVIADSVAMELTPESFRIFAEGNNSKAELFIEKGSPLIFKFDNAAPAKSKYPLDYLKKASKVSRISKLLRLNFGQDFPLKMEFVGEGMELSIVVAPRVSED